ncbi:MAG: transposase [Tannerella sp.]|jgi:hypothetical protein|nr:transposase [Tannerella sp.]
MSKQTGAHKLSETEGLAHIESYLSSGLRPSEYYRKHNLTEYQFYNWRIRYQSVHPASSAFCDFIRRESILNFLPGNDLFDLAADHDISTGI